MHRVGFETGREGGSSVFNVSCEGLDQLTLVLFAHTQCSHERQTLICCPGILCASVLLFNRASLTLVPVLH